MLASSVRPAGRVVLVGYAAGEHERCAAVLSNSSTVWNGISSISKERSPQPTRRAVSLPLSKHRAVEGCRQIVKHVGLAHEDAQLGVLVAQAEALLERLPKVESATLPGVGVASVDHDPMTFAGSSQMRV